MATRLAASAIYVDTSSGEEQQELTEAELHST
jgi:hypothetical protein